MNQAEGKLIVVNDEKQITDKFVNREFVIETEEQYPQKLSFVLVQQSVDLIDPYEIGQKIQVSFNIKGREWTNPQGEVKYFNSLEAWKIQPLNQ